MTSRRDSNFLKDLTRVPVRKLLMAKWKKEDWTICSIKEVHKYIVCIGSNYNRRENLTFARQKLTESFSSICFAPELETKPLFFKNPALFSNQVALFYSDKDEETVRKMLKNIEQRSGRRPEDKKEEKVCLDIDMLLYDNKILKPEDWQRGYIQQSLSAFHSSLFIK